MSDHQWAFHFADPLPGGLDAKNLLGGKGGSLAEMTRAGLNVPQGFTITTEACAYFYKNGEAWPEGMESQVRGLLARLETETGRRFGLGAQPLFVSVRSGAAVSMPGMMDTLLNCGVHMGLAAELGHSPRFWHVFQQSIASFAKIVANLPESVFEGIVEPGGDPRMQTEEMLRRFEANAGKPFPETPWEALRACIDAVFRSWSSERAQAYRKRNNISGLLGTAVNVQVMFPSEVSGIVFTQDPNAPEADRMIIESAYGLGEAVVSGDVTPDRFVVARGSLQLLETHPGSKTNSVSAMGDEAVIDAGAVTLDETRLRELSELSMRVEKYFGAPMDIEWGFASGKFALLQSRTIRGLDIARDAGKAREEEKLRLRTLAGNRRRVWVTHNLGETLRAPTPLTWDIVRSFMSGSGGFGLMYRDFGYEPSGEVEKTGFLELILGRIYADPERVSQLFWAGLPVGYDIAAILRNKNELDRPPTKFEPERADETFLMRLPGALRVMWRVSRSMRKIRPGIEKHFEENILPDYLAWVRAERGRSLAELSTDDLLKELTLRRKRVLDDFGKESLKPPFFAGVALGALEASLTRLMGPGEGARLASLLTAGLDHDTTYEQDLLLGEVAAGRDSMETFLERYGHRATTEMELAEPRWREDASFLDRMIVQAQRGSTRPLEEIHHENAERSARALRELPDRLAEFGGSSLYEGIAECVQECRRLLPYREAGKHYLMMGYELIRSVLVELGRRWDLGHSLFFLQLDELPRWERESQELRVLIDRREIRWKSAQRLDLPDVVDSDDLENLGLPPEMDSAVELVGDPVSSGVATGDVRIIFNPREAGDPGDDYVLVCPSTDPGWTPLFVRARALVVERGGILSHGAIVARDFGIPAIVCPRATSLLREGERIRVDGNRGTITRMEETHE